MKVAASLYEGGKTYPASECTHEDTISRGLVCPHCTDSVVFVAGFYRGKDLTEVSSFFRHRRATTETKFCEERSLSSEGREQLRKIASPTYQGQRLELFNRRFWAIFAWKKDIPADIEADHKKVLQAIPQLARLVKHCRDRWDVPAICRVIPQVIKERKARVLSGEVLAVARETHKSYLSAFSPEEQEELVNSFWQAEFDMLRLKICCEVVAWLATPSGKESFEKLILLSSLDCLEIMKPPIGTQMVSHMAVLSLTLTDWEKAIAATGKLAGVGFGRRNLAKA